MKLYSETQQGGTAAARLPHELFLFNLLFNHILLFIAAISAPSLQALAMIVPIISAGIIGYTLWRARNDRGTEHWHTRCHWQLAALRSLVFAGIWLVAAALGGVLVVVSGGNPGPGHYAAAGVTFFPVMLTVITLILMESEALQHARRGTLPRRVIDRCPFRTGGDRLQA